MAATSKVPTIVLTYRFNGRYFIPAVGFQSDTSSDIHFIKNNHKVMAWGHREDTDQRRQALLTSARAIGNKLFGDDNNKQLTGRALQILKTVAKPSEDFILVEGEVSVIYANQDSLIGYMLGFRNYSNFFFSPPIALSELLGQPVFSISELAVNRASSFKTLQTEIIQLLEASNIDLSLVPRPRLELSKAPRLAVISEARHVSRVNYPNSIDSLKALSHGALTFKFLPFKLNKKQNEIVNNVIDVCAAEVTAIAAYAISKSKTGDKTKLLAWLEEIVNNYKNGLLQVPDHKGVAFIAPPNISGATRTSLPDRRYPSEIQIAALLSNGNDGLPIATSFFSQGI